MKNHLVMAGTIIAALAIPRGKCSEQRHDRCRRRRSRRRDSRRPCWCIVGGVGGAVVGGIADDRRSQFHTYVVQEKRASYRYNRDVVVGAELPSAGVTYYEVPAEYGVRNYRYTVVNDRTVLVDPHSHRIAQVIE